MGIIEDFSDRHPGVPGILWYFECGRLPERLRGKSEACACAQGCDNRETGNIEDFSDRHPAVPEILQYFECGHLPERLRGTSEACAALAADMERLLPDGPELTAGLRKLLEAKDCFIRAAL
jgi:hypothetical protein